MDPSPYEKIETARQAALDVLQPSPRDLEHGLALHQDALVFDAYGFSPTAAVDGEGLRALVEAGASGLEIQDFMENSFMTRHGDDPAEREEVLAAWEAAGVTCVFQNAGEEGQDPLRMLKRLARFTYTTDRLRERVERAAFPEDIRRIHAEGKHGLYFTTNGVPLQQHWQHVEEELRYLRVFFQLGARMMHLTYNRRNVIGDGCAEPADAGLSDFGKTAVREMNRVGVIPDVAHSGWSTSRDVAAVSDKPVVASHTVCHALSNHCRGKPDDVLRAIAETDGVIGVCCIPAFLGGEGDIARLLDHVEHICRTVGADHAAIGSDRGHGSSRWDAEWAKVGALPARRKGWESLWAPDDPLFDPKWATSRGQASTEWTNWPFFTVGLVQRGFSDEDIRKILGGNMLRVCEATLRDIA